MLYVMWAGIAILAVVIVTWIARISPGRVLTAYHDGLPVALSGAYVALGYALVMERPLLASMAGALVLFHLAVVIPHRITRRRPDWADGAPSLTIAVANVLVDNRTPDRAASALTQTNADVIIVNENNDAFSRSFRHVNAGAYPEFLEDHGTPEDYAVAVATRQVIDGDSGIVDLGTMRVVKVEMPCGDRVLTVVGVHLAALTEPGGYREWHHQMRELGTYLESVPAPFVIAGDFNASLFRPAMRRLVRIARLHDAHDVMGKGLTRSLKLGAAGWAAAMPAFTRVDHALLSEGVAVLDIENLPTSGSDHHPFVVRLAVRPGA
ncbi:MAG: endonuclease/exonuclease/phosphatase family protein [Acidimicrobiia bacterium]